LDDAFRSAVEDDGVKVIVLGGEGKHFSSGHDLGTPGRDRDLPRRRQHLWYDHLERPGVESQYVLEQDALLGPLSPLARDSEAYHSDGVP
jgi:enoyl-CoA hydratase